MKFDFDKRIFILLANRIHLTGLQSPVKVDISFGDYVGCDDPGEDLVNDRRPIPMRFMSTYDDSLRVDRAVVRITGPWEKRTDSLTVKGAIATQDPNTNLENIPVIISWGNQDLTQIFEIPEHNFGKRGKTNRYVCRKYLYPDGSYVNTIIDLTKCTFSIILRKATLIVKSGDVSFGVQFGEFNETVTLPLKEKNSRLFVYPK